MPKRGYRVLGAPAASGKRRRMNPRRRYRIPRAPRTKIHNFVRTAELAQLTTSTTADLMGGWTFSLGSVPSATEFTNLFDKFRICAIRLEIIPTFSSNDLNPNSTKAFLPNVHTVIDYNDVTTPGALSDLLQYQNLKRTRGHNIHRRYFKPAVLAANYEGAVTTAYTSVWKRWLDTNDSGTLHYGVKYHMDLTSAGALIYRVFAKYYIQCKDPK